MAAASAASSNGAFASFYWLLIFRSRLILYHSIIAPIHRQRTVRNSTRLTYARRVFRWFVRAFLSALAAPRIDYSSTPATSFQTVIISATAALSFAMLTSSFHYSTNTSSHARSGCISFAVWLFPLFLHGLAHCC